MRLVPGVSLSGRQAPGGAETAKIRGLGPRNTRIFIDGVVMTKGKKRFSIAIETRRMIGAVDARGLRFCSWLAAMVRERCPAAEPLTIAADCGGSNGARVRLWKRELQQLADETGLTIQVSHYPPGTSKWNRVEHRLFRHITLHAWRGSSRPRSCISSPRTTSPPVIGTSSTQRFL